MVRAVAGAGVHAVRCETRAQVGRLIVESVEQRAKDARRRAPDVNVPDVELPCGDAQIAVGFHALVERAGFDDPR
jgi:hypothetical protein